MPVITIFQKILGLLLVVTLIILLCPLYVIVSMLLTPLLWVSVGLPVVRFFFCLFPRLLDQWAGWTPGRRLFAYCGGAALVGYCYWPLPLGFVVTLVGMAAYLLFVYELVDDDRYLI